MEKYKTLFLFTLLTLFFSGCSSMRAVDFADKSPRFVMEQYFEGKSRGEGIFFDRFGVARVAFTIDLDGHWDGTILTLKEKLTYDSGEILYRDYKIEKINDNLYIATTPDVVGQARIESFGNALNWRYRLRQQIGESTWTLSFDDWMFLTQDGTVINRAWASKFGFAVGEIVMSVRKLEEQAGAAVQPKELQGNN